MVELFDIDSAILIIKFSGYFDDPVHVGVPEFLDSWQDGDEIVVKYDFLPVLQDTDATAIQVEVSFIAIKR